MDIPKTVDEYIRQFPIEMQERMRQLRETIRAAAPEANEIISWAMPTYKGRKNIVHFAGHKNHIGFYPGESGVRSFSKDLKDFKTSKGAIQLPNSEPLPLELVRKITEYRVEEDKGE